jgi:hypothetical protein
MKESTDPRVLRLAEQLETARIDRNVITQILAGSEAMGKKYSLEEKTDWFRRAMVKMDKLIDRTTRYAIREGCACCLGGRKLKTCQKIVQKYESLEDRVKAVSDKKYICGSVKIAENSDILAVGDDERYKNRCVCLPQAKKPLSITYCYCCGGHVKHFLQIALGKKLDCTMLASPLSSGDKFPCTFSFKIIE